MTTTHTTTRRYYAFNARTATDLTTHPRVSSRFAMDKGLWDGRKVAVVCITRGDHRHRTRRHIYYGTLVLDITTVPADRIINNGPEELVRGVHIGVRHPDGMVTAMHHRRAVVYDMTRTTPAQLEAGRK